MPDPFIDFQQEEFAQSAGVDDWELSPVQKPIWNEYDEAVRERRDRLARRQVWLRFRHWLNACLDDQPDLLFYAFLIALTVAGGVVMALLMQIFGISFHP